MKRLAVSAFYGLGILLVTFALYGIYRSDRGDIPLRLLEAANTIFGSSLVAGSIFLTAGALISFLARDDT